MSLKICLVVAFVGIAAATSTESQDVGEIQGLVRAVRQVEASSLYGTAIAAPGLAPQYTIVQLSSNSETGRRQGSGVFGSPTRLGGIRGFSSRGGSDGAGIADGSGAPPQLIVVDNSVASDNDEGSHGGYYVPSYSPNESARSASPRLSSRLPAGPAAAMSAPVQPAGSVPGIYMTGQPAEQAVRDSGPIQAAGPAPSNYWYGQPVGPAAPMSVPLQPAGSAPGIYMTGQPAGQAVGNSRPIQAASPAPSNYWSGQPVEPAIPNLAPVQTVPSARVNYFTSRSAAQPIYNFPPVGAVAGSASANYFTGQTTARGAPNVIPFGLAPASGAGLNYSPNRSAGPAPGDYYAEQAARQAASGFSSNQSSGQLPRFTYPGPASVPALSQPPWSNSANIGRSGPNQASEFAVYPANPGYSGLPGYPINSGSSGYSINSGSLGYPINSGPSGYPKDPGSSSWKAKPCTEKILSHCPTCGSSKLQGH